ncbi:MAG: lysozyme inhibitor LprI family protein [Burkholderiales bacterium]|nr:lysozyme inhibitor LprI family protein [Burkholderiales bacterium]
MLALLIFGIAAHTAAHAQERREYDRSIDCSRTEELTGMELGQCIGRDRDLAEYSMGVTYRQLISRTSDKEAAKAVAVAQKSWEAFRMKECEADAHMQGFRPAGSMYGTVVGICLTGMAQIREKELSRQLRVMNELRR